MVLVGDGGVHICISRTCYTIHDSAGRTVCNTRLKHTYKAKSHVQIPIFPHFSTAVPMESIDKGEKGIEIDTSLLDPSSNADHNWTDEQSKEQQVFVQDTLEEHLRSKYSVIDRSVFDVVLTQLPIRYRLEHIDFVPIITREACQRDPTLMTLLENLDTSSLTSGEDVRSQIATLVKRAGTTRHTVTIIADVYVDCIERFVITDKASGTRLAGYRQEHNIGHVVRFEMLIPKLGAFGKWMITDWDDMLDGNVWHLAKHNHESDNDEEGQDEANSTKKDGDDSPSL